MTGPSDEHEATVALRDTHELALESREAYREAGEGRANDLARVEAWLAEHSVP